MIFPVLIEGLNYPDFIIQRNAAVQLSHLQWKPDTRANEFNLLIGLKKFKDIYDINDSRAIQVLIRALKDSYYCYGSCDVNYQERCEIKEVFIRMKNAIPGTLLLESLGASPGSEYLGDIVEILGNYNDTNVTLGLVELLRKYHSTHTLFFLAAFEKIRDPITLPELFGMIMPKVDDKIFAKTIFAIRKPSAIPYLLKIISDAPFGGRYIADSAISSIFEEGDDENLPYIIAILKNENDPVFSTLIGLLKKKSFVIKNSNKEAVKMLIEALSVPSVDARVIIITLLGSTNDPSIIPTLIRLLTINEEILIRNTAAEMLAKLSDSRGLSFLIDQLMETKEELPAISLWRVKNKGITLNLNETQKALLSNILERGGRCFACGADHNELMKAVFTDNIWNDDPYLKKHECEETIESTKMLFFNSKCSQCKQILLNRLNNLEKQKNTIESVIESSEKAWESQNRGAD